MANLICNTCVIQHPCYITLEGVIWQCLLTCYMPCYESGRKSCANQALFLGPIVGGRQVAGSALISWVAWQWCSGTAEWPPASLQQVAGLATACCGGCRLWWDGRQPSPLIWDRCTACKVGEITWFETACANNQSQASLLLSRLMNDHAKTCIVIWWMFIQRHASSFDEWSCKDMHHRCWFLNKFD